MKIIPLNNNLENKKKSTITLYVDCCCCCCCCVLAPLGSVSAEAIMKRKYTLSESAWKRGLFNFLFFALSIGLFYILATISKRFFSECYNNICSQNLGMGSILTNNDFILFASISLLFYFFLLYLYSKSWLKEVIFQRRLKVVLFETIISLVFIFIFSALSIGLLFLFPNLFGPAFRLIFLD